MGDSGADQSTRDPLRFVTASSLSLQGGQKYPKLGGRKEGDRKSTEKGPEPFHKATCSEGGRRSQAQGETQGSSALTLCRVSKAPEKLYLPRTWLPSVPKMSISPCSLQAQSSGLGRLRWMTLRMGQGLSLASSKSPPPSAPHWFAHPLKA